MKTIWKYQLRVGAQVDHLIPDGATILTAQMQSSQPTIWALVDEGATAAHKRTFFVYGTGWDIPDEGMAYIGTVQEPPYVWHVFELTGGAK